MSCAQGDRPSPGHMIESFKNEENAGDEIPPWGPLTISPTKYLVSSAILTGKVK